MNTGTAQTADPSASKVPLRHLAIIMDGNGRWAQKKGLPRSAGHQAGVEAVKTIVTTCRKLGLEYLTLYAFSRENWSRPKQEINFLFDLLIRFLRQELNSLLEHSIRLNILGNWQELPFAVRQAIRHACSKSSQGREMVLNIALNYSGREEILQACRTLLQQGVDPETLSEDIFRGALFTADQPDPDLIIRTSGELRLSNYLVFQAAYSEFYFTQTLWPDFDEKELHRAFAEFRNRQRRFGGLC